VRFGWELPILVADSDRHVPIGDATKVEVRGESASSTQSKSKTPSNNNLSGAVAKGKAGAATERRDTALYGILRPVGRDRYVSPAGLLYTPGSAEGHRLKHLQRHVSDAPDRPGPHGVFDGGMQGALRTIDQAYERAERAQGTTKQEDQGRTIYTVDLGKRIGFVGGREGRRRRNPMARRVRLVLEGNRVITAYPL